jgi:hypothetical protein
LHDSDGNNRLDGLELLAALMHVHEDEEEEQIDEEAEVAKFKAAPDDTQEVKDQKRRMSGEFYAKKAERMRKQMEAFRYYTSGYKSEPAGLFKEFFFLPVAVYTIDYRCDLGVFGCPPTIVKFRPQLLKTKN